MSTDADFADRNDYHGTGQPHGNIRLNCPAPPHIRHDGEPEVLIEFVVLEGPEGERLHELQAEAVRWVLTRLADERRRDTAQEEG